MVVDSENSATAERLFVLRLWRDEDDNWRASLKNLTNRKAHYFVSLPALMHYLSDLCGPDDDT